MIAPHHRYIAFLIADNDVALAFDQDTKAVGIECKKSEEAMEQHQNHATPSVAKKAAVPLRARERTAARMTSRTASNGVFRESERLCPSRTVASVTRKTMIPRSEICTNVKFLGSTPRPSRVSKEFQNAFIGKILSPENALSRGYAGVATLARETFAWHKTTLTRF